MPFDYRVANSVYYYEQTKFFHPFVIARGYYIELVCVSLPAMIIRTGDYLKHRSHSVSFFLLLFLLANLDSVCCYSSRIVTLHSSTAMNRFYLFIIYNYYYCIFILLLIIIYFFAHTATKAALTTRRRCDGPSETTYGRQRSHGDTTTCRHSNLEIPNPLFIRSLEMAAVNIPTCLWAQTKEAVYVTVDVPDVTDEKISWTPTC